MATVFTRIIRGELPGRFVWKDDKAVAFLTINPIRPGHTLVVPREEIDHWLDLPKSLLAHLSAVAQSVGQGIQRVFRPVKVGMIIAGLEVPHVHLHLIPVQSLGDFDFSKADKNPDPKAMDHAAAEIRAALRAAGHAQAADLL
jgi:histidine triad (HIT) family protein